MILKDLVPDSQRTQYLSLTKFHWLVLIREIIPNYPANYTKRFMTLSIAKIQSYLLFKVDGAVLYRVDRKQLK
jgi:hypothetical protein